MFTVGQRVVLVGWVPTYVDRWIAIGARYPNVGDVYTIRAIKPFLDTAVLLLEEIDNSHLPYMPEPGIEQKYFRPVVERKTKASATADVKVPA